MNGIPAPEPTLMGRTDTSALSRWWWTVDRWSLGMVLVLIAAGAILVMAASPAMAERIGLEPYHFITRHFLFVGPAVALVVGVSLLPASVIQKLTALGFAIALVLLAVTLAWGSEINGARRWLGLGALVLQPGEIIKPTFAVVTAWILAERRRAGRAPGSLTAALLLLLVLGLVLAQPDFGMAAVVAVVWFTQVFMAGLGLMWVGVLVALGLGGAVLGYLWLPHVASRVDRFLDPASGDSYQVDKALEALGAGGLFGRGPGEGVIKSVLPDAHADFIFAVAGEEFGLVAGLGIIALFAFIVLRGLGRLLQEGDYFALLAGTGLLAQFGLQALINIGVNLNLMPAKGMTLPFISYGGSSLLAVAVGMGMVLALTRRRAPGERVGVVWARWSESGR